VESCAFFVDIGATIPKIAAPQKIQLTDSNASACYADVLPLEAFMRTRTSALPAAIIPCPNCGTGRFSFQSTYPLQPDFSIEDVVFVCRSCGTKLICTARSERAAQAA
jgi:predicted RNA-binding Zn-ribbon protein involved in translation (DUF1610 family)